MNNKIVKGGQLKLLSEENIQDIHLATMHVLRTTGVSVKHPEALMILRDAGAWVDMGSGRVRFPEYVVMEAVKTAPKTITLYGRGNPRNDLRVEGKRVYFGTGGAAIYVLDLENRIRRPATTDDVSKFAILVENLDNIHFFMIPLFPSDVPKEDGDLARYEATLPYTTKHITAGVHLESACSRVLELVKGVAGGSESLRRRPFISMVADTVSPLILERVNCNTTMECARSGVPVICGSEALAGGTSPVTLAGTLTIINAEVLAALCLHQYTQPGSPFLYGTISSIMDLRKGIYTAGAVETGMVSAAVAQLSQHYGIPLYATAGMSDSKTSDCQAGMEKALTLLTAGLSGANYIHDAAGMLEFALTMSYEQTLIDNEIIGMVLRIMEGISVNDETIALSVIESVGPKGQFLNHKHTRQHMRDEQFIPILADRSSRDEWVKRGSKDLREIAIEKVSEILNSACNK
jgi:trimethylamine---corrinoid protein Co-methyltransferase